MLISLLALLATASASVNVQYITLCICCFGWQCLGVLGTLLPEAELLIALLKIQLHPKQQSLLSTVIACFFHVALPLPWPPLAVSVVHVPQPLNCISQRYPSAVLCTTDCHPSLDCLLMLMWQLQDGVAMLWDLAEGKRLYSLDAGDVIHALCFSPNRYWLCAATQACIKVLCPSFMCHSHLLVEDSLLVTTKCL